MNTRKSWIIVVALCLVWLIPVSPLHAARTRCFAETGFCVSDPILAYWEKNGGLAVFGYPISGPITDELVEYTWIGTTQWFERDRLEDHGSAGVMAGRLGATILQMQGRPWQYGPGWTDTGCRYFAETRYALCGMFLAYWQKHGGLARFGYPITTELTETIEGWTGQVQYFERRRMELHPEYAGTPYEVLLGRLAADIYAIQPPSRCVPFLTSDRDVQTLAAHVPFAATLGCPQSAHTMNAAMQIFAGGRMIWLNSTTEDYPGNQIIAIYPSTIEPNQPLVYAAYIDDWVTGVDPEVYLDGNASAIPATYPIKRGFGKVWYRVFRRGPIMLAPALTPEQGQPALVQRYSSGAFIVKLLHDRILYAFGPNRTDVVGYLPGR